MKIWLGNILMVLGIIAIYFRTGTARDGRLVTGLTEYVNGLIYKEQLEEVVNGMIGLAK
jgi:hypothetical protein